MSAEDAWRRWEEFLLESPDNSSDEEVQGEPLRQADLDETIAYGEAEILDEAIADDNMAQAGAADIAALLAQLTQSNIDQAQREIDRDARLVNAAQARGQQDIIRAQVQKIDKCQGDDKPCLRRWIRDLTTLHAAHADAVVTVAYVDRNASRRDAGRDPEATSGRNRRMLQLWETRPLCQRVPGTSPRDDWDSRTRAQPCAPRTNDWMLFMW